MEIFHNSLKKMLKNYYEVVLTISKKYRLKDILAFADAEGLENLDDVLNKDTGALLYSGHIGNFPLMTIWLAAKGYPIAAVYKEAKNFPDDLFGNTMRSYNVVPLKYKSDAALTASIIRALNEKKIVLIQNDQSVPNGIYIKFFNRWVPSAAGPVMLALRTRVPVIRAYITRDNKNRHTIKILPEISLIDEEDRDKMIQNNVQLLADWIAEIIKEHPSEWLWLHNRWKREKFDIQA